MSDYAVEAFLQGRQHLIRQAHRLTRSEYLARLAELEQALSAATDTPEDAS